MKKFITLTILSAFFCTTAFAISIKVQAPSGTNLSVLKSDTNDLHISSASGTTLEVEGTKAKLFFSEYGTNYTHEVLLAVQYKRRIKKRVRQKKVYVAPKEAKESKICSKSSAKGVYYIKKDVPSENLGIFAYATGEDSAISHAYLDGVNDGTQLISGSKLAKFIKKYASVSKSDLSNLEDDCDRSDGIGY